MHRRLLAGTSRWYQLKHIFHDPHARLWLGGGGLLLVVIFYFAFLFGMPSLSQIQTSLKESSIIYDREGGQLYTIYGGDENRQYVPYSEISPRITHALVAIEDQRFFTNFGFDIIGIIRTGLTCGGGGICAGASSLSQQLIKNTLLTNERTIKRKVQEIILAFELNILYSKEKILELYLNKISFGGNSYGIEQAARRFFGKPSKDVTVIESAILASLPKSPTAYNPYSQKGRLMGYVYYHNPKDKEDAIVKIDKNTNPELFDTFFASFSKITYKEDGNEVSVCGLVPFQIKSPFEKRSPTADCQIINKKDLIEFLNSLQLAASIPQEKATPQPIIMEYQAGRKDRVLMRMYEDGYVNDSEYRDATVE